MFQLPPLVEEIGHGAYGKVYKSSYQHHTVAIKHIQNIDLEPMDLVQDRLVHPNILPILKIFSTTNDTYIMMPYCEEDLSSTLSTRSLSHNDIQLYFSDILKGVAYLHQQHLYHRDLKPANIMIKDRAMLTDFGLATFKEHHTTMEGTLMYFPPEYDQYHSAREQDMWALGCILAHMIAGESLWGDHDDPAYIRFSKQPRAFLEDFYPFSDEIRALLLNLLGPASSRMTIEEVQETFDSIPEYTKPLEDEAVALSAEVCVIGSWDSALGWDF